MIEVCVGKQTALTKKREKELLDELCAFLLGKSFYETKRVMKRVVDIGERQGPLSLNDLKKLYFVKDVE
jgi:hypothetical protein